MAKRDEAQEGEILEAASHILSDEGAAALTVRRIAAGAGCSTMGIYSRFGGKDGVVDALYAEGFRSLCADMSQLARTDDPVEDLRQCELRYRAYALAHATHYMVMFGGAVPDFTPSQASKALAHDAFANLVANVQRCIDAGAFRGNAPELAHTLWSAMHGQVMLELVGINPVGGDPDARYRDLVDTVLSGLQAR
ncbi:MAG: TetR/AcrR family transcriptional regulator [Acidimicrobiia bacterium]